MFVICRCARYKCWSCYVAVSGSDSVAGYIGDIGVDDCNIRRIQSAVITVTAAGGCQHDGVALVAVFQRILDASDGDRLIGIIVRGGECERGG